MPHGEEGKVPVTLDCLARGANDRGVPTALPERVVRKVQDPVTDVKQDASVNMVASTRHTNGPYRVVCRLLRDEQHRES